QYARLRQSLEMATSFGITTVVEPQNSLDDLALFVRAQRDGDLRSRLIVALFHPRGTTDAELDAFAQAAQRFTDDRLRVGPLKLYIDDVIERHTAAMLEPYSDEPTTSGALFYEPDEFAELITKLDARGFQTFTHAIGDRGIRTALDAIERAQAQNRSRDRRHQIVHVECVHPDDIPRFARLGVVPCVQPRPFAPALNADWVAAVGPERSRYGAAWRSLHDTGAPLAFSSDWNVTEMDPLIGIYTAVTRADLDGGDPWMPHQAVDLPTAIHAYTLAGAYANFCEGDRGSITPGKYADLIVLSDDLFAIPASRIPNTKVELTTVGGVIQHDTR
ncbi:MAG: amidohydrolase family protein, partial [Chloroflexota bacterium]|nr:amidohydrolase family protein [Chloroflexota bacterium]